MLRLLVISALLCVSLHLISAEESVKFVKEIRLNRPHSGTIVNGSYLLTIASNRTHIFVNSTDELFKPCQIEVDYIKNTIQKNVKATILGDKILIWGVRTRYEAKSDYSFLIVDPKQCTYKSVTSYEEDFIYFNVNKNLPEVIAHDDSFDVFYSTMTGCAPCRYSFDAKRIDLKRGFESEPLQQSVLSYVMPFNIPELNNGYFYAYNYDNKTAVMKLYDHDFNVVKQKSIEHPIDVAAVNSRDSASIISCYYGTSKNELENEITCERYDAHLELVFSKKIPLMGKKPRDMSVVVDNANDSFLYVVENQEDENIAGFRLYKLDSSGRVVTTLKLDEDKPQDRYHGWWIRGFMFDGLHCFEISKVWPIWFNPETSKDEYIKCLAI